MKILVYLSDEDLEVVSALAESFRDSGKADTTVLERVRLLEENLSRQTLGLYPPPD